MSSYYIFQTFYLLNFNKYKVIYDSNFINKNINNVKTLLKLLGYPIQIEWAHGSVWIVD